METTIISKVEKLVERIQSNSFQGEISDEEVYLAYLEGEEALKVHAMCLEYLDESHLYGLLDCESKETKKFSLNAISDYIKKHGINKVAIYYWHLENKEPRLINPFTIQRKYGITLGEIMHGRKKLRAGCSKPDPWPSREEMLDLIQVLNVKSITDYQRISESNNFIPTSLEICKARYGKSIKDLIKEVWGESILFNN